MLILSKMLNMLECKEIMAYLLDDDEEGEYEDEIQHGEEENEPVEEVEGEFNKPVVKMDEESKKVETPQSHTEHKQPIVSDGEGGNALFLNELLQNGLI